VAWIWGDRDFHRCCNGCFRNRTIQCESNVIRPPGRRTPTQLMKGKMCEKSVFTRAPIFVVLALMVVHFNHTASAQNLSPQICGVLQTGGIAKAEEPGQQPGSDPTSIDNTQRVLGPPNGPVNVHYATNSNQAAASLDVHGSCSAFHNPAGTSMGWHYYTNAAASWGNAPKSYAWAHWSPTWTATLVLPSKPDGSSYKVSIGAHDILYNSPKAPPQPGDKWKMEPGCSFTIDANVLTVPVSWYNPGYPPATTTMLLNAGSHRLVVRCDRGSGNPPQDWSFDETVDFSINIPAS